MVTAYDSVVGSYRAQTSRYLLLVRLLRQGTLYLKHFSNFEVCNSCQWSPNLLSFLCRMIGSEISLIAIPSSNAVVNITISSSGIEIWNLFNSSLGSVTIIDLPLNQTTLVTITYITSAEPAQFGLQTFVITVPVNA